MELTRSHTPRATEALALDRVTKVFPGGVTALHDVSLAVQWGERACLLGPNGAGKTTIVRLLEGALAPTGGTVAIAGVGTGRHSLAPARAQVGIVPQQPGMYEDLRLGEYLEVARRSYGRGDPRAAAGRLGLATYLDRPLAALSGGLQRRAVLAAALLAEPSILILDEPTAGLDPLAARDVVAVLREAMHGRTSLLCTHNLAEAEALCDSAIILRDGRVVLHDRIDSLRARLDTTLRVRATQGAVAVREALAGTAGYSVQVHDDQAAITVRNPEQRVPDLLRYLLGAGIDVYDAVLAQPTLEDLFFQALAARDTTLRTSASPGRSDIGVTKRADAPPEAASVASYVPVRERLRTVLWKELRQLPRKRGALVSAVVMPLILLLAMPVGQMVAFTHLPPGALAGSRIPEGLALPGMISAINRDPALAFRVMSFPLAVLLTALVGPSVFAQHTVVDERERRTLELLVALPLSLPDILAAKLLATVGVSVAIALPLFLVDAVVAGALHFVGAGDLLALVALQIAALCYSTAASLLISLLAGDFRTASNVSGLMIGPLILVALGFILALPPGTAPWALAALLVTLATLATFAALKLVTVERLLR